MEEAFIPHDTNLVFWLGLLLFREEFGMLLSIILETKLFPLHDYYLWSLQVLKNYIWVAEWARLFSLFLRVRCVLVWNMELD